MKKTKLNFKLIFTLFLLVSQVVAAETFNLIPTGDDDSDLINEKLNEMKNGDTIILRGDFIFSKTIYLPSNITWILNGTLTLKKGDLLDEVGYSEEREGYYIRIRRPTAIAEKNWNTPEGNTNITMIGGTYDGARVYWPAPTSNNPDAKKRVRLIHFSRVKNSTFRDMHITRASDDCFTLGNGCKNNVLENLLGDFAGIDLGKDSGNGLSDKGEYNVWTNCKANYCTSDGWTPKSRYSQFINCEGNNNAGPGWGMYCRVDGARDYDNDDNYDIGENISFNKFINCEASENDGSGFSFNVSATSGSVGGGLCTGNELQGVAFHNKGSGVLFRVKAINHTMADNIIDVLCYRNKGVGKDDDPEDDEPQGASGGLGVDDHYLVKNNGNIEKNIISRTTGVIVAFENNKFDVNLRKAKDFNLKVFEPEPEIAVSISDDQNSENNVFERKVFNCEYPIQSDTPYAIKEYIKRFCEPLSNNSSVDTTAFNIYPNPTKNVLNINSFEVVESITMYDFMGKIVLNNTFNSKNIALNVSHLNTGIYMIKVGSNVQKVIIK